MAYAHIFPIRVKVILNVVVLLGFPPTDSTEDFDKTVNRSYILRERNK